MFFSDLSVEPLKEEIDQDLREFESPVTPKRKGSEVKNEPIATDPLGV